jgi:PAP2 superfamily
MDGNGMAGDDGKRGPKRPDSSTAGHIQLIDLHRRRLLASRRRPLEAPVNERTVSSHVPVLPRDPRARLAAAAARALRATRRVARSCGSGPWELFVALAAYGVYAFVKGFFRGTREEGLANGVSVINAEQNLGIFVERDVQQVFLDNTLGMPFWNAFYLLSQIVVLPATLILVFLLARHAYPLLRNLAILSWIGGVVWYALQPVVPPRHADIGVVDTISTQTFFNLDGSFAEFFYNPVAAMPSLHVGMAPVVAWALWRLTPWMATRVLGLMYPVIVAVTVVVTGNHYLLDIVGGLALVLPAAAIARLITGRPDYPTAASGVRYPGSPEAPAR